MRTFPLIFSRTKSIRRFGAKSFHKSVQTNKCFRLPKNIVFSIYLNFVKVFKRYDYLF